MDLNSIDPRATSQAAESRKTKSQGTGVFQGVMQMMAQIDENRTENQVRERSASDRPSRADDAERDHRAERKDKTDRKDKTERKDETAGTEPTTAAKETPAGEQPVDGALLGVPELATTAAPVTEGTEPAAADGETIADDLVGAMGGQTAVPAAGTSTTEPTAAQAAAQQAQAAAAQPTAAKASAAAAVPVDDAALAARQASAQSDQAAPAAKPAAPQNSGDAVKAESASGRADALMGAKVSVEAPVPVARSQGVSSAVLVQAQQAAAGNPVQASTANGGAGTLHVGGNQPTFVGADAGAATAAGGQGAAGNDAGGQNGGANAQGQNQGQGGQPNPQQVGVSFGATIGQRGFGGDASRAQFQEILATRTARAQPASAAGGEAARPLGASSTSSTPMTLAGVGGPQSTHTSASPVDRAAAPAHGRPGATLGTPADQVAMKMSATAKDGGGKVTIRLSPEELGKVDIRMEISKEGLVRAVVAVDRPETLELLQRDAKGLERILQDAGLQTDSDSLEFDLRGDGGQYAGDTKGEAGNQTPAGGAVASSTSEGDAVADDQQGDGGSGGVNADGSLDLVA